MPRFPAEDDLSVDGTPFDLGDDDLAGPFVPAVSAGLG